MSNDLNCRRINGPNAAEDLRFPLRSSSLTPNDGISINKAVYKIVAMILRLGETHENGHFVAVHSIDKFPFRDSLNNKTGNSTTLACA